MARKRKVVLGESSYEQVEGIEGLRPGKTVVVSDISRCKSESKLKIRD